MLLGKSSPQMSQSSTSRIGPGGSTSVAWMHLIIGIVGAGLLWVMPTWANELIVVPAVGDEAVIGKAIQNARDGDTVRIQKGIYRETLVLSKPLELVGVAGAVVDPSERFEAAWQPAREIGPGV